MSTSLSQFGTNITTNITPQNADDKVTASEMRATFGMIKTLFSERGIIVLNATSDLANTPSTETQFVLIDGVGLFIYKSTGVPDNRNSFPAQNGGRWLLALPDAAISSILTAIAGLSPIANDFLQYKNGGWSNRTPVQVKTDLALENVPNVDTRKPDNLSLDPTHRFITDVERNAWNAKQNQLVSGQTLKTINGQTLLGAGDVQVTSQGNIITDASPSQGSNNAVQSGGTFAALAGKRDKHIETKNGHGFGLAWAVYKTGGVYQRANAATNGDARKVVGLVMAVPDANTFVLGKSGDIITGLTGLTAGAPYYLSETTTAGTVNYTSTRPSVTGQWTKILFIALSTTEALVVNEYGYENADPSTVAIANDSITNAMLAAANKTGLLAALTTNDKSSLVAAINELKTAFNGLGSSAGGADKDYISLPPISVPGSPTASASSSSVIGLSWTGSSYNVLVQRSTSSNTGFATITTLNAGATSYNDTGLPSSTQFYYRWKFVGDGWTTRDSQWVYANATTSVGGGGATVEQSILLNFTNPYRTTNVYSDVQGIRDTGGTAVADGSAASANVRDINNVATAVDFALTSAGIGSGGNLTNGADPSNDTVFGKEQVAADTWLLNNNGTFKLSGLVSNRTYKLYFWSYTNPWEHSGCYFTANGVNSGTLTDSADNKGDAAGDPLLDGALRMVTCVSDNNGEIAVVGHNTGGTNVVPLTALYIQRMSS